MYLCALEFRNDKVTRCQYAYNLKIPDVRTAFGEDHFELVNVAETYNNIIKSNYLLIVFVFSEHVFPCAQLAPKVLLIVNLD